MNDALFCSIHVDSALPRDAMASLVAELTGGVMVRGGVDCAWGRVSVDDAYGTFEVRAADPDDFLGWPALLEIMPSDSARRERRRACGGLLDDGAHGPRNARARPVRVR
jgi:hypothetical protein